ncbi:TPA: hypothetical protein ACGOZT_000423 [Streptococcus suis]
MAKILDILLFFIILITLLVSLITIFIETPTQIQTTIDILNIVMFPCSFVILLNEFYYKFNKEKFFKYYFKLLLGIAILICICITLALLVLADKFYANEKTQEVIAILTLLVSVPQRWYGQVFETKVKSKMR